MALQVGRGAVAGVGAWVAGYVLTYLLRADSIRQSFATNVLAFLTDDPVTWKLVGWLFFNEHLVSVSIPGILGRTSLNALTDAENPAAVALLFLPPVLLVVAGALAAHDGARDDTSPAGSADRTDAAMAGGSVVAGYLPLALVFAVVTRITVGGSTGGPDLLTAVVLAGVVYPVAFGAIGGLIGRRVGPAWLR